MVEYFDIYDNDENHIGKEARNLVHKKWLRHKAIHIRIYKSNGDILIQKRAKNKDSNPGLRDISIGGHFTAWDDLKTTIYKESKEELWININLEKLESIATLKVDIRKGEDYRNKEINYEYLYQLDEELKFFTKQDSEIEELRFIDITELEKEIFDAEKKKRYSPHGDKYYKLIISEIKKRIL